MDKRCATCAFRPGCVTHDRELDNRLAGELCVLIGDPFYCHKGFDYAKVTPENQPTARQIHICEGWKQNVAVLAEAGYYNNLSKEDTRENKWWGRYAIQSLKAFVAADDPETKQHALDNFKTIFMQHVEDFHKWAKKQGFHGPITLSILGGAARATPPDATTATPKNSTSTGIPSPS